MSSSSAPSATAARLPLRWFQLGRAAVAALAAIMITFSPDHGAAVGLAVFSGFAITTALVHGLAAWVALERGQRWPAITLAIVSLLAGIVSGIPAWRGVTVFFAVVIAWAALTGIVEIIASLRERRRARAAGLDTGAARDGLTVGILSLLLVVGLLLVRTDYILEYSIEGAGDLTLTGIVIAVGLFGGYAAIIAVFLAIAGFSPSRPAPVAADSSSPREEPAAPETATGTYDKESGA